MSQFGKLLRTCRKKCVDPESGSALTQERLGERLGNALGNDGYTGAAVSDWERGKSHIHKDDRRVLVSLLRVLYQGGGLHTVEEADRVLLAGNYRPLDQQEERQIFVGEAMDSQKQSLGDAQPVLWPPHIVAELYYPLPGRQRHLAQMRDWLLHPGGPAVVALEGLGGLGKTAIAVELARRLLQSNLFEGVVGDSAKQEILSGGEIVQLREATLNFEGLLDAIAQQLGRWELATLKEEEKHNTLARFLRQHPYIVLVDNLETANNANALIAMLPSILGASRAIVTSRTKVLRDFVHAVALEQLDQEDALVFLRTDATQRNVQQILDLPEEKLIEIYHITGGAPLAMKLVVAQARFVELEPVLTRLQQAGGNLYPFMFRQSWAQLSPTAQRVLIYMGRAVVTTASWEELAGAEIAEGESDLVESLEQLVTFSLLNVSSVSDHVRYGIHQLTRQFINSALPDIWQK